VVDLLQVRLRRQTFLIGFALRLRLFWVLVQKRTSRPGEIQKPAVMTLPV